MRPSIRTEPTEEDPGSFRPTAGVRQGCVLSPTLFILMFDYIIRISMKGIEHWPERCNWPVMGSTLLPLLGYADDLVLVARRLPALRARLLRLEAICSRAGMCLSTKTKVLYIHPAPGTETPAIPLRDLTVEPVTSFIYLGSEVNGNLNLDDTIRDRMSKAGAVFGMLRRIWAGTLPLHLKTRMYLTLVRPVALYGAETWTLLPAQERSLDAAEMRWIRQLLGVHPLDLVPNTELRARAHCPVSLSEVCRQYRLRYYGHLCRIPFKRTQKVALLQRPAGTRRPGRPPLSWYDLIEADAQTRGFTRADLMQHSRDRERYREEVVYGDRLDGKPTRTRPRPT